MSVEIMDNNLDQLSLIQQRKQSTNSNDTIGLQNNWDLGLLSKNDLSSQTSMNSSANNSTDALDEEESCVQQQKQSPEQKQEQTLIYLIRHGTSIFNERSKQLEKEKNIKFKDESAREWNMDQSLLDTPLSEAGLTEVLSYGQNLKGRTDIHTIFISPLKRTLETCKKIFQDHPQRHLIKFIVLPYICEVISKMCDISEFDLEALTEEYPWFDFSPLKSVCGEFSPEAWQLFMIQDEISRQQLTDIYQEKLQNCEKASFKDVLIERLHQVFPKPIETYDSVHKRASIAKSYIKNYILEQKINDRKQQIYLISHNAFIRNFTSQVPDDGNLKDSSIKGKVLKNCEKLEHLF